MLGWSFINRRHQATAGWWLDSYVLALYILYSFFGGAQTRWGPDQRAQAAAGHDAKDKSAPLTLRKPAGQRPLTTTPATACWACAAEDVTISSLKPFTQNARLH